MLAIRTNPDDLLAPALPAVQQQARQQGGKRGKLKVFFGMAAGVGKTYAMLEEARARAAEGLSVVVGYAEPHIRTETEALLLGMEILPYKTIEYRNLTLKEFDLDAAIARKPALLCVDELAHTNAPGMRHAKRWQDIAELLDAGINVYTTLNVQHIESVNDIVERITGVRVRETLPDSVLEQADEVELVDIAPEELLERFREGKVYRADQAEQAAKHFFTRGNLIALRELALRTTAQRVDDQMQEAREEAGVRRSWAASERVLVCVGPSPMSRRLVRSARRLATSVRAQWIAAYVESPQATVRLSVEDRKRVEATLRLADELGAKTVTLTGENVADEVIHYAQRHNVTKIVIGKPERSRWRDLIFGSVLDELVRRSGEIDIYVIRGSSDEQEARAVASRRPQTQIKSDRWGWAAAVVVPCIVTAIGWPLFHTFGLANANILMLYLLGVLWIATHHSRSAAVVASLLSVALYDVTFVPPYYTLVVSDRQYLVTFGVMLLTALVISTLTHRVRAHGEAARERERRTAALFALSRDLAAARTTAEIAAASVRHVSEAIGRRTTLLFLSENDRRLHLHGDSDAAGGDVDEKSLSVAQWAYEHDQLAGRGTNTLPAADWTFMPLRASRGIVGVLGLSAPAGGREEDWSAEQRQLAQGFVSQIALAVERGRLAEEARAAWEQVEAEFLRNTLLSGVSHELRTPLAGITGAASALAEAGEHIGPAGRTELLATVLTEAERMDRLINNLLDMTRLESGGLTIKKEWQPVQEVIGSALHRLDRRLQGRRITTHIPAELPLVHLDGVLIEQVLINLLDNAVEYTPAGAALDVTARQTNGVIELEVADEGPGLPPGTEKRVFEKFFRIGASTHRRGTGLGLAICRGIVEAHGGAIDARNRPDGHGAIFRFTIPATAAPPTIADTADIQSTHA